MLYNLFCKVLRHPLFRFNQTKAIVRVIASSKLPRNLKQYYADRLFLLTVASK